MKKELAKRPVKTEGDFLRMAIDKNLDVDKLEKLIQLKTTEDDRRAKREFDQHFSEMQAEFTPAKKTNTVRNKYGAYLYAYAPLEEILRVYQPIINRHGFSYSWNEETLPETKEKRIWCVVSGWGHEKKNYVDIPVMQGNEFTNSVQQRGVASTFGKRYTFNSAFGIIISGEDNDARTIQPPVEKDEPVRVITKQPVKPPTPQKKTLTPEQHDLYIAGLQAIQGKDSTGKQIFTMAKILELKKGLDDVMHDATLAAYVAGIQTEAKKRGMVNGK